MPRRGGTWSGPIAAAVLLAVVVSVLVLAQEFGPEPVTPGGPIVPPPHVAELEIGSARTTYSGGDTVYTLNVTYVATNLSWNQVQFSIVPGPLSGAETNWTLQVVNTTSGVHYDFVVAGGNWTTTTSDTPRLGEAVVVSTDTPLVGGAMEASWPAVGAGSFSVSIT
jgi:hypothetical protein